jgi:hypothetical protein
MCPIWFLLLVSITEILRISAINGESFISVFGSYLFYYLFCLFLIPLTAGILPVSVGLAILAKYCPIFSSTMNRIMYISVVSIVLIIGIVSFSIIKKSIDSLPNAKYNEKSLFYKILLSNTQNDFLCEFSFPIRV